MGFVAAKKALLSGCFNNERFGDGSSAVFSSDLALMAFVSINGKNKTD
jgi:hypothetical protein